MDRAAKKSPPKDPGGHKWKGPLPKGWTDASRKKFWNSLTSGAPKHKVTECIKKMDGKVGDPGAFCAALADRSIPGWREEAAKERRKKKALAEVQKVAAALTQPLRTRRDYGEQLEEDGKKPHSQIPGTDSLPMEEDPKVASRVVSRWLVARLRHAKYSPEFMQAVQSQKFRNPDTGNDVLFVSLPSGEQQRVYQQWAARAQRQQGGGRQQRTPSESAWERGGGGRGQRDFAPEYWFSSLSDQEKGALSEWVRIDPEEVSEATGIDRKKLDEYSSGGAREEELDLDDVTWLAGHLDTQGDQDTLKKLHEYVREKTAPVIREIQLGNLERAREVKRQKREQSRRATVPLRVVEGLAPAVAARMRQAGMTRMPARYVQKLVRTGVAA